MLLSELLRWFNCFIFGLVINYEVSVVTGDVRAAGTNAKVFMQIYGETGKTELIILENRSNNFERGATDIFKVRWRQLLLLLWGENDQPKLRHQQNNWSNHTNQLTFNKIAGSVGICCPLVHIFGRFCVSFEKFCVSWSDFHLLRNW